MLGTTPSMHWYWESAVRPLLVGSRARTVVEVGAGHGHTTKRLVELARERRMTVHVVDPAPNFDAAALAAGSGGRMIFHRARSHDILPAIGPVDVALIDGDHNWYTVHGDLQRLWAAAEEAGRPAPAAFLHDVEWPYARRDMYYDPKAIPDEARQPWARRGIVWGQSELSEESGPWAEFANALEEGTPRTAC